MFLPRVATATLVLTAVGFASPRAARADTVIANADAVRPFLRTYNVTVREGPPGDAAGSAAGAGGAETDAAAADRCYHISVKRVAGRTTGLVYFHLRPGMEPSRASGVAVRLRVVAGTGGDNGPVHVQLLGLDAEMHVVLRRWVDLQPGGAARDVSVPWTRWQWGVGAAGGPADVRMVGLRVDQPGQEVELDDLRFTDHPGGVDPATAGREWLRRVAFGKRDVRTAEADGLLVITDATEELSDADLARILSRVRRARALVHRLFGNAVLPIDGAYPPALLIFRDKADYQALPPKLGREWADELPPAPTTFDGITLQNISLSTFHPGYGPDRPVYLHETVHAIVANDLRLGTVSERTNWLHEGLATYVQLLVHPLARNPFPRAFAGRAPADGGYFKALERVMSLGPDSVPTYVQCASVIAYLVENKPDWLRVIARELAAGKTTREALEACGSSVAELEREWLEWGKKKFPPGPPDTDRAEPVFPVPVEFRDPVAVPAGTRGTRAGGQP